LHRTVAFVLLIALLPSSPALAQDRQPATAKNIDDGDTIKVRVDSGQTVTVRLIGMDTPEIHHATKPVQCF
jgi:endonuclease YncB( thermonuclease family)